MRIRLPNLFQRVFLFFFYFSQISTGLSGGEDLLTKFDKNPSHSLKESQLNGDLGELVKWVVAVAVVPGPIELKGYT